jgi:hypothetical protein
MVVPEPVDVASEILDLRGREPHPNLVRVQLLQHGQGTVHQGLILLGRLFVVGHNGWIENLEIHLEPELPRVLRHPDERAVRQPRRLVATAHVAVHPGEPFLGERLLRAPPGRYVPERRPKGLALLMLRDRVVRMVHVGAELHVVELVAQGIIREGAPDLEPVAGEPERDPERPDRVPDADEVDANVGMGIGLDEMERLGGGRMCRIGAVAVVIVGFADEVGAFRS